MDVVYGDTKNQGLAEETISVISKLDIVGTVYVGYPVIASLDDKYEIDVMMVSREHGLVVVDFWVANDSSHTPDSTDILKRQDDLFMTLFSHLSAYEMLRKGRNLSFDINIVTLIPSSEDMSKASPTIMDVSALGKFITDLPEINEDLFISLQSVVQTVAHLRPSKRRPSATTEGTMGYILKQIESGIANLDKWQKRAAIETPRGPQRIRGLAGSGKTIVLALKAAYLHAQHPDWTIVVTFFSRSLYQQFVDIIKRFTFDNIKDDPNWDYLKILHAWGGGDKDGVYTDLAWNYDIVPRDYGYAAKKYGMDKAFEGVCRELLDTLEPTKIEPFYDAVIIDEAQDLPSEFFSLLYRHTKEPKRIIWAYDELQNLSEKSMPTLFEMFGEEIVLENKKGKPRQDIVLPVCYRNTPWALTIAHGLGFGINRSEGLVQHFDDPTLWQEIGYDILEGEPELGQRVKIRRSETSYPRYFDDWLDKDEAVVYQTFSSEQKQYQEVAKEIKHLLDTQEIEHDDILIVLPSPYYAKSESRMIATALNQYNIDSHLAGTDTSRDKIYKKRSIAIAHVYRSKGNEAAVVYALNSQYCFSGRELTVKRNKLFTAITRSRGWVRIYGVGDRMKMLSNEIQAVVDANYVLEFQLPTEAELSRMRAIHREMKKSEKETIDKTTKTINKLVNSVRDGDIEIDMLPTNLQEIVRMILDRGYKDEL